LLSASAAARSWPESIARRNDVPAIRSAFPDFRYEVLNQLQDGDTHVGYVRASDTMNAQSSQGAEPAPGGGAAQETSSAVAGR